MAILVTTSKEEMPYPKALARAKTGSIIGITPAPVGIGGGNCFAHMLGVQSMIDNVLFVNNTRVCSNDEKGVHGRTFTPFLNGTLVEQQTGTKHDFYLIFSPDQAESLRKNTGMEKPVFQIEADEIEVVPLCSGKSFVIIETKPNKRISLVKWAGLFSKKVSAKGIPLVWEGPHALYVASPNSIVVGAIAKADDGVPITRFFRGHDKTTIHSYLGTAPTSNSIWATDDDFFYQTRMSGEDVVISAKTKQPVYYGARMDELYATSTALVRHKGPKVWANNILVTSSFNPEGWAIAHAHGLIFFQDDWIKLLFIGKDFQK